ncbi:SHD1 domain-containing protein [Luteolibacter sp. Populi]|uniref:SHD1 domain-containing protein n=1 Tax=Luteolibacter sp. Populi TaxID=3230487 RepID=UPI00346707BE
MNLPLFAGFAIFAALTLAASAQEARTWTDTKGRKLEGAFLRQDEATVWVKRGDGKEIAIPKKTLSPDDLKHLESAAPVPADANAGGAPATAGTGGRFNDAPIDPTTFQARAGGLKLDILNYTSTLETDHYIIAGTPKIRPATLSVYAEVAERLWVDLAADFPDLAEAYKGGLKMALLIFNDEKEHAVFASWHEKHAEASSSVSPIFNMTRSTISGWRFDKKFADEAKIATRGRAFRMDGKGYQHNKKTWPQRIHFLSSDILNHWVGNATRTDGQSLSMVAFCLAFHREQLICGRIETEVSFGGGSEVEGFKNGRNWAGATKKLLKAGATPDIKSFLEGEASEANPRDLGMGLGLMQFIRTDPARQKSFSKMLQEASSSKESPDGAAFAKAIGFASAEELNKAWLDYMLTDAFQ